MIDSKYRVGDKVLIKSDLDDGILYGSLLFTSEMLEFRGCVVTISEVCELESVDDKYAYHIKECDHCSYNWYWSNQMIVGEFRRSTDKENSIAVSVSNAFLELIDK